MSDREITFRDLYLSREYRIISQLKEELQGVVVAPADGPFAADRGATSKKNRPSASCWKGIIFIRLRDSPWCRGAFPFTIEFPARYPFECPVCTFDECIRSHPLLLEGRTVQFQAEYTSLNPMQVSVFVRLLKFLRRLFSPQGGTFGCDRIDVAAAQMDVKSSSIARVDQQSPYYALLTDDMRQQVLLRHAEVEEAKAGKSGEVSKLASFDRWFTGLFTSVFLPKARSLPASKH